MAESQPAKSQAKEVSETYAENTATNENQLSKWCKQNGLKYTEIDLDKLHSAPKVPFVYVYTGDEENAANGGYPHHWLFLFGSYLFDSYGYQKNYKLPKWCQPAYTSPQRLQSYNSNVCGEFCSIFYRYVAGVSIQERSNVEQLMHNFVKNYRLTADTDNNDATILREFQSSQK